MLRGIVAQRPSKYRRIQKVDGYVFPRAMLMLRGTVRNTGAFPEQENCNGVKYLRSVGSRISLNMDYHPLTAAPRGCG